MFEKNRELLCNKTIHITAFTVSNTVNTIKTHLTGNL